MDFIKSCGTAISSGFNLAASWIGRLGSRFVYWIHEHTTPSKVANEAILKKHEAIPFEELKKKEIKHQEPTDDTKLIMELFQMGFFSPKELCLHTPPTEEEVAALPEEDQRDCLDYMLRQMQIVRLGKEHLGNYMAAFARIGSPSTIKEREGRITLGVGRDVDRVRQILHSATLFAQLYLTKEENIDKLYDLIRSEGFKNCHGPLSESDVPQILGYYASVLDRATFPHDHEYTFRDIFLKNALHKVYNSPPIPREEFRQLVEEYLATY